MRRIFYVNQDMCGGDSLPEDFDLEEFCEVLQGKVQDDIEVVAAMGESSGVINRDGSLISQAVLNEALGEYCHR